MTKTAAKGRDERKHSPDAGRKASSAKRSPVKSRLGKERRRPLKVIKSKPNRLAAVRKARAAKVLKNARATKAASKETKVYIGNLLSSTKRNEIDKEFRTFGRIVDIWLAENPPGFAFVNYAMGRDATKAVREMDGKHILGSRIKVEIAKSLGPKPRERPARDRPAERERPRGRRLSDSRRDRSASDRPAADRSTSQSDSRQRPIARTGSIRDRLTLPARGRDGKSTLRGGQGLAGRKGRKKKGGKRNKRRGFARPRAPVPRSPSPLPAALPRRSLTPLRFSATPELRLGSPPRRGSGVDLPPPPPLLPMPPVDLYDVFDSRYRNREFSRYRDNSSYNGAGSGWRSPSPRRSGALAPNSYYARSPSPRGGPRPRTPPQYYSKPKRRSLSPLPLDNRDSRRPLSPPRTYRDPYMLDPMRSSKGSLRRSSSPGWRSSNYLSPPQASQLSRRPPSPPPQLPPVRWSSPPRAHTDARWRRSPSPLPVSSRRDSSRYVGRPPSPLPPPPPRRPPSPLPAAYKVSDRQRSHSPRGDGRLRSLSPRSPPQAQWQAAKRYRSPSPVSRQPHGSRGRSRTPMRPRTPPGRAPQTPPPRPRTPPSPPPRRTPPRRSPLRRSLPRRSPPRRERSLGHRARSPKQISPVRQMRSPPPRARSPRARSPPRVHRPRSPPPRSHSPLPRSRTPPARLSSSNRKRSYTRSLSPRGPVMNKRSRSRLRVSRSPSPRSPVRKSPKRLPTQYRDPSPGVRSYRTSPVARSRHGDYHSPPRQSSSSRRAKPESPPRPSSIRRGHESSSSWRPRSPSPPPKARSPPRSSHTNSRSERYRTRSPSPVKERHRSPLPRSYRLPSPARSPPKRAARTPPRGYTPPPSPPPPARSRYDSPPRRPPSPPPQRWSPSPPRHAPRRDRSLSSSHKRERHERSPPRKTKRSSDSYRSSRR